MRSFTNGRRFKTGIAGLALVGLIIFTSATIATPTLTDRAAPTTFVLGSDSTFMTGCFPAPPFGCAGPVFLFPVFVGSFDATSAGQQQGFEVFELDNVAFLAGGGTQFQVITGTGVYRRSVLKQQQEMILDVSVNGGPVTTFDSGIVALDPSLNSIEISVDMNDLQNYDTLMSIAANPSMAASAVAMTN